MSAQDAFLKLKNFFETKQSARQAMGAVEEGVEIGIILGGSVECALYRKGSQPMVELRAAHHPDVVFHIKPETVEVIADKTKDEIGEVGVNVLREFVAGNIQIKVPGRFWNVVKRGYLDMIKQGGAPVTAFLARRGLSSVPKIISAIKKLKT